jgi:hypothetical protein
LESREEGGNRGEGWGSRSDYSGGFEVDEICDFQLLSVHWVFMVLRNILLDQALLVDIAWVQSVSRSVLRAVLSILPDFDDATGCCGASPETAKR